MRARGRRARGWATREEESEDQGASKAGAAPKWLVNLASKKSLPGYYKGFETMAATMMMEDGVLTASSAKKWGVKK